ncbi:MAG TPA: hypothetical protein VGY56_18330 [Verrucomicrobiae bacterium]|nr:hypothetical protein [Verrucomicrobiae bacterium]
MNSNQLTELNDEIKRGHNILRGCRYDAKNKRLTLILGFSFHEGSAISVVVERATEPQNLPKWIGQEIYGVRVCSQFDRTEVHMDFGPTITFTVLDETASKPPPQEEGV